MGSKKELMLRVGGGLRTIDYIYVLLCSRDMSFYNCAGSLFGHEGNMQSCVSMNHAESYELSKEALEAPK